MQSDFQTWWNARYFYSTHPLYATFKRLSELEIDLNYVDFLCDMLRLGDYLRLMRPVPKVNRKQEILGAFFTTHGNEFSLMLRVFATLVVGFAAKEITEQHLPKKNHETLLSPQDVKNIVSTSCLAFALWMGRNATKDAELSRVQRREELEQFKTESGHIPIVRLFLEYNKPVPPKRGNKSDSWGTLFLLGGMEYLREKTGKPHYGEVVKLLQKTRAEYEKYSPRRSRIFPKTTAQSALVRVANFKKTNPSWKEVLDLLKAQFRMSRKGSNQVMS